MKKQRFIFVMLFCLLTLTVKANDIKEIALFFENKEFITKEYHMGGKRLLFSYIPSNQAKDCVYKAILYEKTGDSTYKHLIFDKNVISNSKEVIFNGVIETQKYYGWKIEFVEKNNCILTDYVTNEGKNITEGPTILFDDTTRLYKLYVQDRSQW
ncbi:MAG: hypothetical protein K6E54_07165 [Bacteroidaceae bacterium]|nr:hypothetical protein [Bacteroidaceae bacterium]